MGFNLAAQFPGMERSGGSMPPPSGDEVNFPLSVIKSLLDDSWVFTAGPLRAVKHFKIPSLAQDDRLYADRDI